MNLRTITLSNRDDEALNAALVCAFHVKAIGRSFLAHSLNEKTGDQLTRVYLAAFVVEQSCVQMTSANADDFTIATRALKCIFDDAISDRAATADAPYRLIDLGDLEVLPARLETHHQLQVNPQWVIKLLSHAAGAEHNAHHATDLASAAAPLAVEVADEQPDAAPRSQHEKQDQAPQTLMSKLSTISTDPTLRLNFSFGDHHRTVQPNNTPVDTQALTTTASNISAIEQKQLDNLKKFERNFRAAVARLNEKKDALEAKRLRLSKLDLQLMQREAALADREAALQNQEGVLNISFLELAKIDSKLSELFRGLAIEAEAKSG